MKQVDEVKRNEQNRKWYEKNLDPWGFRVNDCVMRSFSIALLMKYEFLFAYAKNAVDENAVWNFSKVCNFIGSVDERKVVQSLPRGMVSDEMEFPKQGMNVNDAIDYLENHEMTGVYVFIIGEKWPQHAVCAYVKKRGSYFVDTDDCGDLTVFQYYKIIKQVPKGDVRRLDLREMLKPDSWKLRFREMMFKLAQEWEKEVDPAKKQELAENFDVLICGEMHGADYDDTVDMNDIGGEELLSIKKKITGRD